MRFAFPDPLYPIVDPTGRPDRTHVDLAETILASGVGLLQLRAKETTTRDYVDLARSLKALCDRHGAALIVNDRADVAKLVDAAGVHLGQDDLPPAAAREILGPSKVIGFSTHNFRQAEDAIAEGVADYLAFGPIFPTASKANPDPVQGLDALRTVRRLCPLPLVAIGGITRENIAVVIRTGTDAAAVIAAITHADDPSAATRDLFYRARGASTGGRPRSAT
jgi:thiamine-phosphate pyrophosphorylase